MTDYEAFASLWTELGLDETPPPRERFAAEIVHTTIVDERDGSVDGYVQFHTLGTIGYVRQLVVSERARGHGNGTRLMLHAAAALRAAGVAEWHLNVKTGNTPAIRLYEQLGLRAEHTSTALRLPWSILFGLPFEPATALPVTPEEDDDLERGLGLLAGQIAMARRRTSHVLRQLRAADCAPVGFASFDPDFPGARIFRVARPTLAATLLRALRPHAQHDHLALVIDDDESVTELLVTHGAIVKLRLLHYVGPVPETTGM
ncbi:MAG: GNAT family N-acetyltransferase [Deltaproteobacteria bacterium]|nr:GNAT family N-acetyltransferase [Deltaproteobacteria bacterium]